MAIEAVSPEIPVPAMSPRISFSHDFCHTEAIPVEQRPNNSRSNSSNFNSSFDFDFCIRDSSDHESSSADEIFSHGRILPLQIKKKSEPPHHDHSPKSLDVVHAEKCLKKDRSSATKETKAATATASSDSNANSKSFWRFKRSSSCGSGYTRSLCPLPLLSRSNSTGSATNLKRSPLSKDGVAQKQSSHRNSSKQCSSSSSSSSSMGHQKPPLKKVHGSSYGGNGVQVNPILNVHSANLFGLGSLFSSGKKK